MKLCSRHKDTQRGDDSARRGQPRKVAGQEGKTLRAHRLNPRRDSWVPTNKQSKQSSAIPHQDSEERRHRTRTKERRGRGTGAPRNIYDRAGGGLGIPRAREGKRGTKVSAKRPKGWEGERSNSDRSHSEDTSKRRRRKHTRRVAAAFSRDEKNEHPQRG